MTRVAVVTGVSRRQGIGFAVARRLLADGMSVLIHSWSAHDAEQPWGAEPIEDVLAALGGPGARLAHVSADLAAPGAPASVIAQALERFGSVDVLVANHARSSSQSLDDVTAEELDLSWAVNARAVVLLVQAFAAQRAAAAAAAGRRIVLFTSGQHLGPMPDELPYAVTKGAVHQMTRTLSDALADDGITVNAINPGPVDTGWASAELHEDVRRRFPAGRWGRPEDIAAVVAFLASAESGWITGQVIDAEGGFRRG